MNIFQNNINNKRPTFLKGYISKDEIPSDWSEFIHAIHNGYGTQEPDLPEEFKKDFMAGGRVRRGALQIWGYMTIFVENPPFNAFKNYEKIKNKAISDFGGRVPQTSFALINLSSHENITNKHADNTHNLYFQCIGSVTWNVYDDEDNAQVFELEPGDAILVPAKVYHQVFAHEPRTAFTIGFPNDENLQLSE